MSHKEHCSLGTSLSTIQCAPICRKGEFMFVCSPTHIFFTNNYYNWQSQSMVCRHWALCNQS